VETGADGLVRAVMHFGDRPLEHQRCSKVFNHPAQRGGGGLGVFVGGREVFFVSTKLPWVLSRNAPNPER